MRSDTTGFWIPVALSADVPAGTVIPAVGPTGVIALWRSQSGHLAASANRCPHRGMSLSHGFVRGEVLSCIYHGWSYGMRGNCLRIPAHPGLTPPDAIRVETHEARDSNGVVWVASGAPDSAPPSLGALIPLRSLTVKAGLAAIETAAQALADGNGLIETSRDGQTLWLLLAPQGDDRTLMHVLLGSESRPGDRITASRSAEMLRRSAETVHSKGSIQ